MAESFETGNSYELAYPTGSGIEYEPEKSPGPSTFRFEPKRISHSLRKEMVQKGRRKSWLSM